MEKGSFPAFDSKLYCKSSFVSKKLPPSIRKDIRKHGTRNVTLMAMAPTGTISLIPEVTSGIEPLMYKAFVRNDRVSKRHYIHPIYISSRGNVSDWFVDTADLNPMEHLETQAVIQQHTDGAVSKTINLPGNFKADELSDILLESVTDLKGVTVYRDGSRKGQVIKTLTDKQVKKHLKENKDDYSNVITEDTVECTSGVCEM
jgi:ribonucleoside-diphosphate reductase alpha chain